MDGRSSSDHVVGAPSGRRNRAPTDHLIRLSVIALFALTAFRNLQQPGLHGDEAWTVVQPMRLYLGLPAVDTEPLRYVRLFGRSLPFMPSDYIGPVQGYIFLVGFALFGLSIPVVRVTTSLLGLAGVLCFYEFARLRFGRLAATAAALLLATDLTYLLLTRHDFGAVSFCFFALSASLWLLSLWTRDRQEKHLFFGALLLGLGLTQRVNFLASIVAVAVSVFLAHGRSIRPARREVSLAGLGFLAGAWPVLLYNAVTRGAALARERVLASTLARPSIPRSLPELLDWIRELPESLAQRVAMARLLLDGSPVADYILRDQIKSASPFHGSLLGIGLLVAVPVLVVGFFFEPRGWRRSLVFAAGVFVLTFALVALIPIASGPHHVAAIYPFPHLFVGLAVSLLWTARPSTKAWRGLSRAAAAVLFLLVFVSNLWLGFLFHSRLAQSGGRGYWTEAINDLARVLSTEYADRTIQVMDWGIAAPVLLLTRGRVECQVPFWHLAGSHRAVPDVAALLRTPGQAFVLRPTSLAFSEKVHTAFFQALREQPGRKPIEKRLFDRNGELAFRLLELPAATIRGEAGESPRPTLERLVPSAVTAGERFNVQPSGEAAIAVLGSRFTPGSVVIVGSRELVTVYGSPGLLTAFVPRDLYSRPDRLRVLVRGENGTSETLFLIVWPRPPGSRESN